MEPKTRLRQVALEAAVKTCQYDRNISAYDIIAEAKRFYKWLVEDELDYTAPIVPVGQNLDDEIPF